MKEVRQRLILEQLSADKKISFVDLSQLLNVSYDSIRRDVIELEDKGFLKKVHGGAVANSYLNAIGNERNGLKGDDLKVILKKTLPLFKDGQVILMDGGNTNFFIAEQLAKKLKLTIVTNSLPLAMALNEHPTIEIILLGGIYFKHYEITMGLDVIRQIERLNVDMYVMGINGIDFAKGCTIRNYEEAILKQKMMEVAKRTICCVIEEKIGVVENFKVSDIGQLDTIVTNLKPDDTRLKEFKEKGVTIL